MTDDPREFRPPREPLSPEAIADLREWLDQQRFDIVAAYHAAEVWPDGEEQENVYLALRRPRRFGASSALYLAVSMEMPSLASPIDISKPSEPHRGVGWGFPSGHALDRVRRAVPPLWERDPTEPPVQPKKVAFVYRQPEVSDELRAVLRDEFARWPSVEGAYFTTRQLVVDGDVIETKLELLVDTDEPRAAFEAIKPILKTHLSNYSIGNASPDREAIRRKGLVVFRRDAAE